MVRQPAVAGTFYPADATILRQTVKQLLRPSVASFETEPPKALIVPHAGYVYSGPVAGCAYAQLAAHAETVRRVVLLGPTHRAPVRGMALPEANAFATPLGEVQIDQDAIRRLAGISQVVVYDAAHASEHSLEVQLPFLQSVLHDFALVPLAVGDAKAKEVAGVLEVLWGGPETLIVISSDLSHYHSYRDAQSIDQASAQTVLALSPTLGYEQACGALPINGLLTVARRRGLRPELLDLRNSGDTAGDKFRVFGYASFVFSEAQA